MKKSFLNNLKLKAAHLNNLGLKSLYLNENTANLKILSLYRQWYGNRSYSNDFLATYLELIDIEKVFNNPENPLTQEYPGYWVSKFLLINFLGDRIKTQNSKINVNSKSSINKTNTSALIGLDNVLNSPKFWEMLGKCIDFLSSAHPEHFSHTISFMGSIEAPLEPIVRNKVLSLFKKQISLFALADKVELIKYLPNLFRQFSCTKYSNNPAMPSIVELYGLDSLLSLLPPLKDYPDNILLVCLNQLDRLVEDKDISPHYSSQVMIKIVEKVLKEGGPEELSLLHSNLLSTLSSDTHYLKNLKQPEFELHRLNSLIRSTLEKHALESCISPIFSYQLDVISNRVHKI